MIQLLILLILNSAMSYGATIAIIDTGFDLDHDYLKPKILNKETDEEAIDFHGWDFFDNSHLKKPVIEDKSSIQEILLFRNLRAKGHRQGLSLEEFEWYKKKNADKAFMEKVKLFKKHSHGTFVAGIALREGENINIFPIRGLNLPNPVVAVEDSSQPGTLPARGKTSEEKFHDEVRQSINRVSRKFSKICQFVSQKKIEVVNASYGITFKNIMTKFRERYKEMTGKEIDETKLKMIVDDYFNTLYQRGEKTMRKHSKILFVFSAGNSGLDNDTYHHYPSRIKVPNAITVAAMNGDYLATFSNYGKEHVDIGAPGVAILSIVPKVYSEDGSDLYSPASGTSMAAPYVSNLAAQLKNTNPRLSPSEIKKIILETGESKDYLKPHLASGAIASNHRAIRAALLSKDMVLDQAITLGKSDLIPMEDKVSIGRPPVLSAEEMHKKVMDSVPSVITPGEVEEEPTTGPFTKSESSLQKDTVKAPQDNSVPPPSEVPDVQQKSADPVHSSQSEAQSPPLSEERPASSSEPQPSLPEAQSPESLPSLPQS
ncbi:MAG: S8 family serine peptidase [Bacteriovoracaceae bacterium]|nr:S8 family serine peptidase [Bacteriovoracaceae bacterium]